MHRPLRDYLKGGDLAGGSHHFDVGQPVSYADDVEPDVWKGGYEIIELPQPVDHEPQYVIRNADERTCHKSGVSVGPCCAIGVITIPFSYRFAKAWRDTLTDCNPRLKRSCRLWAFRLKWPNTFAGRCPLSRNIELIVKGRDGRKAAGRLVVSALAREPAKADVHPR